MSRIVKFLARAGICSRRQAIHLIETGQVTINGEVVTKPNIEVGEEDIVKYRGNIVEIKERELWAYHKPKGYLTTRSDPENRPIIYDQLPNNLKSFFTVGRLDFNSEGLLLLTNDGDYKRELELPQNKLERIYKVRIFGKFKKEDILKLTNGIKSDGEILKAKKVEIDKIANNSWLKITLIQGKNREIRRMLELLGYKVNRLIRISYGKYQLLQLKPGEVIKIIDK